MKKLLLFTLIIVFIGACSNEADIDLDKDLKDVIRSNSKTGDLDYYIMPESNEYDKLPNQDPANKITKEKIELGRLLFFETGSGA